jgi:dTDP-4-dehydrorhamnose 3,5-epimerase
MPFQETKIKGSWVHTPIRHLDSRGSFEEQFKKEEVSALLGDEFVVAQSNQSISTAGVVRGIHFTTGPNRQAKFVSCVRGAIWDVVVDLRKDSNTYLEWVGIELTPENGLSVLINKDLGHLFMSLKNDSIINYLCSTEYDESNSGYVNPLDPKIGIGFSALQNLYGISNLILSDRDYNAPFIVS